MHRKLALVKMNRTPRARLHSLTKKLLTTFGRQNREQGKKKITHTLIPQMSALNGIQEVDTEYW